MHGYDSGKITLLSLSCLWLNSYHKILQSLRSLAEILTYSGADGSKKMEYEVFPLCTSDIFSCSEHLMPIKILRQ